MRHQVWSKVLSAASPRPLKHQSDSSDVVLEGADVSTTGALQVLLFLRHQVLKEVLFELKDSGYDCSPQMVLYCKAQAVIAAKLVELRYQCQCDTGNTKTEGVKGHKPSEVVVTLLDSLHTFLSTTCSGPVCCLWRRTDGTG